MHKLRLMAIEYFNKAHANQWYDQFHYSKHLDDAENVLLRHGYNEEEHLDILIAIRGHDAIEDTNTSYNDIKKEFNEEVAEIISLVTDSNIAKNRKEKKAIAYPRIKSHPDAIVIKLADRIANIEHSIVQSGNDSTKTNSFLFMYKKEYKLFRWNLHVVGHAEKLWATLDKLMEWKGY